VNRDEAKTILLLYRPGTADADDPQIAEALALAKSDPELSRWLEEHVARQNVLREKFRQIAVPDGLKEQIVSEQSSRTKIIFLRRNFALAMAAIVVALVALSPFLFQQRGKDDNTLAIFQSRMAGVALRGYAMDLETNDAAPIRAYLAQNNAPSDFILPAPLQQIGLAGCAVENWQAAKVSMICFHTGKSLPAGESSDLWLFVVDRVAVKNVSAGATPQFAKVNQLVTAVWTQGDKLYLLGTRGDEELLRKFL
jgi:uncharacterized membrane protein YbaN (DUF454 family)